jgi:archaetidylinositol phosphate synthase
MSEVKKHERVNDILLGPLERPLLQWLAGRLPPWLTPDWLTVIGIAGTLIVFVGYALSWAAPGFLWLASFGFFVNWFGDSLDGTVARYRHIERPRYGFFIDHTVDAGSQVLMFSAIGLSPYVSLNAALLALVAYLLVSIYAYVDTYVTGRFKISYGKLGPTEVRVIAILLNAAMFYYGVPQLRLPIGSFSVYDLAVLTVAAILFVIFTVSVSRRASELRRIGE